MGALRDAGPSGAVVPESAVNMLAGRGGESAGARLGGAEAGRLTHPPQITHNRNGFHAEHAEARREDRDESWRDTA